ncbi:phytoene/squalene synthase family protein [Streptomyces sp. CA-181903]|uniref:phytoene/squalene synthase family protein n=1 Tax=Streptomyces sp. CA-181903 TaxID=3240055 RepID=UPI003D8AE952
MRLEVNGGSRELGGGGRWMLGDRVALRRASISDPVLREAYRLCGRLLVAFEGWDHWAGSLLLPADKRPHSWAIYALIRWADELADSGDPRKRADRYDLWCRRTLEDVRSGRSTDPLCQAFTHTAAVCSIDVADVEALLAGLRADLSVRQYATWEDVRRYITGITGAAGRMFLRVLEPVDPRAEEVMVALEEAMQLTDMLRDVVEDARQGRVYLPAEDLQRFGIARNDLRGGPATPQLRRLVRFQVRRAHELFAAGAETIGMIRPDSRPCLWAITETHRTLLAEIEQRDYDVFSRRVALSPWQKSLIACRAAARGFAGAAA